MKKIKNEELNRMSVDEFREAEKVPLILILDNIRSLNNVGSAFRTADAFLIEKICLCGITGQPPHREINKTALGATDTVNWEYHEDARELVNRLREQGYGIIAVEQADEAVSLPLFHPDRQKLALIFGNEVNGVSDELISQSDTVIDIPQFGTKHSLNVSVSIGIVIWDLVGKMEQAKKKLMRN